MSVNKNTKYAHINFRGASSLIMSGEYTIPAFQRNYVWNGRKIIEFLNSVILCDEPFGYIIIWEKKDLENIGEEKNNIIKFFRDGTYSSNKKYVIDGQQRLTSLMSIYKCSKIIDLNTKDTKELETMRKNLSKMFFNFMEEKFEFISNKKNIDKKIHIPIKWIFNDFKFTDSRKKCEEYLNDNYDSKIIEKIKDQIQNLQYNLSVLEIGLVSLNEYDLNEVIDIFNKINTKGKKLTLSEIIISKWHSLKKNLEIEINSIQDSLCKHDFDNLDSSIFIDSLYLIIDDKKILIKGEDKISYHLDAEEHLPKLDKFKAVFKETIEFLNANNFNKKTIPSEIIIKWMSYFFYKNGKREPNSKQTKYLIKYIILISLNKVYSSSTTQKLEKDIKFVNFLLEEKYSDIDDIFNKMPSKEFNYEDIKAVTYSEDSMQSRIIDYFLYQRSCDFNNGIVPKNRQSKDIEIHHIFPKKALFNDEKTYEDAYDNINSYGNLIPLYKKTNTFISNKKPSVYYMEYLDKNKNLDSNLKDCFINPTFLESDSFEELVDDRSKKIADFINKMLI